MTVWPAALLRSEPRLKKQHCELVFEVLSMRANTTLLLSLSSNFVQVLQVVSDAVKPTLREKRKGFPWGGQHFSRG